MSQVPGDISNDRKILEAEPNDVTQFENNPEFLEVEPIIGTTSSRVAKLKARNPKDDVPTPRISRSEAITNFRDQNTENSRSSFLRTSSPEDFTQTKTLASTENSAFQRAAETYEDWDPPPLLSISKCKTGNVNVDQAQNPRKILASRDWHHQANSQAGPPLPDTPTRRTGNTFDSSLRICEPEKRVPSKSSGPPIWNAVNKAHATAPSTEENMDVKPSRRNEYRRIDRVLRDGGLPSQELIDEYETQYREPIPAQLQNRIDLMKNELKAAAAAEKKRKAQTKKETPRKTPRINTASSPTLRSGHLRRSVEISPIEEDEEYSSPDKFPSSSPLSVGQLGKMPQHIASGDKNRPVFIEDNKSLDFTRGVQMKGEDETVFKTEQIIETRTVPENTQTAVTSQAFKIGAKTVGIANKLFEDLSEAVTVLKHTRLLTGSGTADAVIRNFERSNYTHKLEKPRFFFLGKSNDTHPHFMVNGPPIPSRFIPVFTIPMTENDEVMLKVHQQNVLKDSALFQASATGGHNPITWYSSQETWKPETKVIAVTEDEYNYLVEARKARYTDLTNEGETVAQDETKAGPAASATKNLPMGTLANIHSAWPKWAEQSWEHQRAMINRAKDVAAQWNNDQRERVEIANTLLPPDKQQKFESVEWERFMRVTGKPRDPVRSMEYLEEAANIWDNEIENDTVLLNPDPPIPKKERTPSPPQQVQNLTTNVPGQAVAVVARLDQPGMPSHQLMIPSNQSGLPLN
ncbi:hypothetical protein BGAL_0755g00020 [Botrytis galanthina]|uniref:Uncharacterized protein n=1 Tax=Botrytis galanthina TaxID=278940 RepID=A0A4V4HT33_9HELO|nr:hypothetical protein BGAL_0755g00020 [Botrytis galanthina]